MVRVVATCLLVSLGGCDVLLGLEQPLRGDAQVGDGPRADVMRDMAIDAPFDPSMCPADYSITLASTPQSRYRLIATSATISVQHADCKDDRAGATHLIATQTQNEAIDLGNAVGSSPVRVWVGFAQLLTATTPTADWYMLTGEMVPAAVWDGAEPEDNGGGENGAEQVAFVEPVTHKIRDDNPTKTYYAMCECDGRPVVPNLEAIVQ